MFILQKLIKLHQKHLIIIKSQPYGTSVGKVYKTKLLAELLAQNPNLNHIVERSFQGVNRLFVLAFEDDAQRTTILSSTCTNKRLQCYD